jgi:uracil-DNA glycosylase family 4
LNFNDLIQYVGGQPPVKNKYESPLPCTGYCVHCDEKFGIQLSLISHGCDSSDFEHLLGPLPAASEFVDKPILFLLERPVRNPWEEVKPIEFRGFRKNVPVQHYYWSTRCKEWPKTTSGEVEEMGPYGDYFAYLMQKHGLRNVYITNFVKCSEKDKNDPKVEAECFDRYLRKELDFFRPAMVFCFGWPAHRLLEAHTQDTFRHRYLSHPSAIYFARRHKKPDQTVEEKRHQMFEDNDRRIKEAISKIP